MPPCAKRDRRDTSSNSATVNKRARGLARGTANQPIEVDATPRLPCRPSPRKAIADALQATLFSQASSATPTFESQLRDSQAEAAITPPTEGSGAATIATIEAGDEADRDLFDGRFADNFNGIDWTRLPGFMKPLATQKQKKSWIYRHGYRVALIRDPQRIWFVCKYCHLHKTIDLGGSGLFDVTRATTAASAHLHQLTRGHGYYKDGKRPLLKAGQRSLAQMLAAGVEVEQSAANAIGNFNVQRFRLAAVLWLVDNNHPLREFETPAFRAMIEFANPEAEAAL
jgi:hypothetical protein